MIELDDGETVARRRRSGCARREPAEARPDGPCVLAVDLGTGGPKVAVVAESGRIVAHAAEPVPLHLLDGGGAEQDPDDWWSAIRRRPPGGRRARGPVALVGVGCTAQWSGTVAVDAAGSRSMRAVIWMDSRGNTAIREVAGGSVNVLGYDPAS